MERKSVNMCMKCNTEKEEPEMVATIKKLLGTRFLAVLMWSKICLESAIWKGKIWMKI